MQINTFPECKRVIKFRREKYTKKNTINPKISQGAIYDLKYYIVKLRWIIMNENKSM